VKVSSCMAAMQNSRREDEEGLEEPRSEVRAELKSEVRSEENSEETGEKYGELRSGDIGDMTCANREGILYHPIQTAPSQDGFQSTKEGRRPTRSTVKPSQFRDDECETQFRPEERRQRSYRDHGRGNQARSRFDKFYNFHRTERSENKRSATILVGETRKE